MKWSRKAKRGLATAITIAVTAIASAALLSPAPAATSAPAATRPATSAFDHLAPAARPIPAVAAARIGPALVAPPTTAQCRLTMGITCYSPRQLRTAYGMNTLDRLGFSGQGQTIAVVESFGSPTIAHDLKAFDDAFGLPAPPSLTTIEPAGAVTRDTHDPDQTAWALETTLDVEYAHAMAPGANILIVATPIAETEGVQGFPEIVRAENYVIDNHLAQIISQSFGATENTFPTHQALLDLRSAFVNAASHRVTVLASSGDTGSTGFRLNGRDLYRTPVNSWPSSDPLVTSVGGTRLFLDSDGRRTKADAVWGDDRGAGGGGLSQVFARPAYQDGVQRVVGSSRGTPDISMSAAADGGVLVYWSPPGQTGDWRVLGGTSEAAPLFSGILAIANQVRGRPLGNLNPLVYQIGDLGRPGLTDITTGDNTFAGVTGASAAVGYDLASGWGTVNATGLVLGLASTRVTATTAR